MVPPDRRHDRSTSPTSAARPRRSGRSSRTRCPGYGLDAERLAFLGYSNGANLLAAVMQLHPGLVRCAVLLRSVQVLDDPPAVDLSGTAALLLDGRDDPLTRGLPTPAAALRAGGALVEARELAADHGLTAADVAEAAGWLERNFMGRTPSSQRNGP
jgi:phospholipase/carboxylesterase